MANINSVTCTVSNCRFDLTGDVANALHSCCGMLVQIPVQAIHFFPVPHLLSLSMVSSMSSPPDKKEEERWGPVCYTHAQWRSHNSGQMLPCQKICTHSISVGHLWAKRHSCYNSREATQICNGEKNVCRKNGSSLYKCTQLVLVCFWSVCRITHR